MEQLINDLKLQIKEALNLEDLSLEDFDANAPLFGEDGIGLDSIDVLELIVLLEKKYGIRLSSSLPSQMGKTTVTKSPSLQLSPTRTTCPTSSIRVARQASARA